MKSIKQYLHTKTVIRCKTEESWHSLLDELEKLGAKKETIQTYRERIKIVNNLCIYLNYFPKLAYDQLHNVDGYRIINYEVKIKNEEFSRIIKVIFKGETL